jgi:4-hydroxy-3-methylbut-2-enyl diphosphate reductase
MAASEGLHGCSDAEPPPLRVLIAAPRGFCAGVDRAIQIVELALSDSARPSTSAMKSSITGSSSTGCVTSVRVFVDELDEVPDDRPVVFSAHGVPKAVPAAAQDRELTYVDATCPVGVQGPPPGRATHSGRPAYPVHRSRRSPGSDRHLRPGSGRVDDPRRNGRDDVADLSLSDSASLAFLTQTTLSVDDTAAIVDALKARFPDIRAPRSEDICYATSNRQAAVKAIAPECDRMLVIGAPNSSNSLRLAEVAERMGAPARLIERAADIDWNWLGQPSTLGLTAGASAPELLVREVVDALRERFEVTEEEADHSPERMVFKLPRELIA